MIPIKDLPDDPVAPSVGAFRTSFRDLPDDPALPAMTAFRDAGLTAILPELGLPRDPGDLRLCGYTRGSRATFEARAGDRRFALKVYAHDPKPEAELYMALGRAGLAGDSGPRVPRLLCWVRDLRVLVLGWLDGPAANQLLRSGRGARAGGLAAAWLKRLAMNRVGLGPPLGPAQLLYRVGKSVAKLDAADHALGIASEKVAMALQGSHPKRRHPRLVHGTLYARHVLDLGDGPGVIDWQRFGQGDVEVDAGMFLATLSRHALRHPASAGEAVQAEREFSEATRDFLDERALAWHRSEALLHVASRGLKRGPTAEAKPLVDEAARWAEVATREDRRNGRFAVRPSTALWPRVKNYLRVSLMGLGYGGLCIAVAFCAEGLDVLGVGT